MIVVIIKIGGSMRNIKLTYEYDGTNFFGLQRQHGQRTVAGEIEKVLKILLKEEINMVNSGRTDRGVHALMQVSSVITKGKIPVDRLEVALRRALPKDINLLKVEEVPEDFSARFSAKWRSYEYKISAHKNIFERNSVLWVDEEIDIERLFEILKPLIGRHNFDSFRKADCQSHNPIREVYDIKVFRRDRNIIIYIKANAFMKSMVRIIVGSALAIYFGKENEDYIKEKLRNPDKQHWGKYLAEPQGLYLCEVSYE